MIITTLAFLEVYLVGYFHGVLVIWGTEPDKSAEEVAK